MPDTPEEVEIGGIIRTAVREQKNNNHPTVNPEASGAFIYDGMTSYYVAMEPEWLQGLRDAFDKLTGDDDGDGVSNFFDRLHGVDDKLPTIDGVDGMRLAKITSDVYQQFGSDGESGAIFYKIKVRK